MKKPFELLREISRFGAESGINLNDPSFRTAFGLHVADAVERAGRDPVLLQGYRAEAMFEAMVASFGHVQLIKQEDTGPGHASDKLKAPDFRIVLKDGTNWLVEVKNIYEKNPFRQRRTVLNRPYRRALQAYADATGGRLKLAVFWARWSIWTLVDPEELAPGDRPLTLDISNAVKANELAALGDQTLGIQAPLRLKLTMDPVRTSPIGADGFVQAVIAKAQLFSAERELFHPGDQRIAFTVMQYSDWISPDADAVVEGDRLIALEFQAAPEEPAYQGFELAGSLSRMFARYYADRTLADGKVVRILAPAQPEWFGSLRSENGVSRMPVWRFIQQPNYDEPPLFSP
ncbi:MAG: hypothetical protein WA940_06190 [Sphingopyxis sp.]